MTEEEQIRDEIAQKIKVMQVGLTISYLRNEPSTQEQAERIMLEEATKTAVEILSIKGLRVEAGNQIPPNKIKYGGNQMSAHYNAGYEEAQQDMLKDGWVKCEVKEE